MLSGKVASRENNTPSMSIRLCSAATSTRQRQALFASLASFGLLLLALLPGDKAAAQSAAGTPGVQIPNPPLTIEGSDTEYEGRRGISVELRFNKPIDLTQLKKHLTIDPPVDNLEPAIESDNRLKLYGDWKSERGYKIKITPGFKDRQGHALDKELVQPIKTGKPAKYFGFDQQEKYYFPKRGGATLNLETRNVQKVKVTLQRLFPSNIAVALDSLKDDNSYGFPNWSEELTVKKLDIAWRPDALIKTPLDPAQFPPLNRQGVYTLSVTTEDPNQPEGSERWEDDEDRYYYNSYRNQPRKILLMTRMGALAHWQDDELILFVHDLYTLKPLMGAKVSIYSDKNQLLGTGNTGLKGLAHLTGFKKSLGAPRVAVIEKGNDYTFLELRPREEDNSQMEGAGERYNHDYDAFLYADRELYRPGELIHLRWLVRKNYGEPAGSLPLQVKVIKPNGKSLTTKPTTLSNLGAGGLDLTTEKTYPTGKYRVQLQVPGKDAVIGAYSFHLEEFVPARMKAELTVPDNYFIAGRDYSFTVTGQHLFGAPAADRKSDAKVRIVDKNVTLGKWKEFQFSNEMTLSTDVYPCGEATTNKDGAAAFKFNWKPEAAFSYPVKARLLGNVYELGGRAVSASKEVTLFPSGICLGLSAQAAEGDTHFEVTAAAVQPDETPAALDKVTVTFEKQVWDYYLRRYYGYNEQA